MAALAALPASTGHRHFAENGLKSLFKILKGRRLVFTNPMKGIDLTRVVRNLPLPLDPALIRAELASPNPVVALAVALVAFHGLTGKQVRELQLTDIVDGRLQLDGRDIPLAAPVRTRLAAWLGHRNRTWPATANPHLPSTDAPRHASSPAARPFRGRKAASAHGPCAKTASLHEIHATGGDVRRIYDLFGLSVEGGTRYMKTLEHPDLRNEYRPGTWP